MRKTPRMREVERRKGKSLELLIREGLEAGKDWNEIASELMIDRVTLHNWTRALGGQLVRTMRFGSEEYFRERL